MPKVKIYFSQILCPCYIMAKNYFKKSKVDFVEIDASKDKSALYEMVKKSGQIYIAVIEIYGKIIVGFNPKEIDRLLMAYNT